MTADALKDCNKRHLAQMAKEKGITGWHAMRKDQLIRALSLPRSAASRSQRKQRRSPPTVAARRKKSAKVASPSTIAPRGSRPLTADASGDAHQTLDHACQKDRIIVLTRDSYWLHAYWELSRTTLSRAQAALDKIGTTARPILRVMDVSSEDTTSAAERQVRRYPDPRRREQLVYRCARAAAFVPD